MRSKGLYAVAGVLGYCVSLVFFALSPWFVLTLVATALLGVTNSVQMVPRNTAILSVSPDALRGRVEAFRSMLAGGVPPLGFTLAGALAATFGAPAAVLMGAGACAGLSGARTDMDFLRSAGGTSAGVTLISPGSWGASHPPEGGGDPCVLSALLLVN